MPLPLGEKVDLVLEGGGVKGIGLVGAMKALEDHEVRVENIAGTSAGAIVAALHAVGYTADELKAILLKLDFEEFKDETLEDRLPIVGQPLSVLTEKGIYKGDAFHAWIAGLLKAKGKEKFGCLKREGETDPKYLYSLRVIASDVTGHEMLRLPQDAAQFEIDPDELSIADAVRMSMSIPIFFEPWKWSKGRQEHLVVDGGVLSNFPVWMFDSEGVPEWPTIGLMLVEPDPRSDLGKGALEASDANIVTYLKDIADTMLQAHDRLYLKDDSFVRTIGIPTLGVRTTDFGIQRPQKEALFEAGKEKGTEFIEQFDFPAYVAQFRKGGPPSQGRGETLRVASPTE